MNRFLHVKNVPEGRMVSFSFVLFVFVQGSEQASLYVNVTPCNQSGKSLDEDYFVDDTKELLGKPYHYKVGISNQYIRMKVTYCRQGLCLWQFYASLANIALLRALSLAIDHYI
jgi:hypothetical protein